MSECDAYLARVETCWAAMLGGNELAFREILVDERSTSLRMYDQQALPYCH